MLHAVLAGPFGHIALLIRLPVNAGKLICLTRRRTEEATQTLI
ncbi:hypothetical protein ASZ90_010685 [hydrocarbon metagenome]|uniref:Uncharacterized protein n=1 Tax=hydrocarbon metagenome TaxID=938273 RepID=A0A0W8FG14_9ZZZZ